MPRSSHHMLMFLLALQALALVGCQDPRRDVPGHLQPGNVDEVTKRAGMVPASGDEAIAGMGLIPLDTFTPPMVPLVDAPEVGFIWFYPVTSRDGRSQREGHYVYTLVRESRWGIDKAMHEGRIDLNSIHDIEVGRDGRAYVRRAGGLTAARPAEAAAGSVAPLSRPWEPSGKNETRITLARPDGSVIATSTAPDSAAFDEQGRPTQDLKNVLDSWRANMEVLQRQNGGAAGPATGATAPAAGDANTGPTTKPRNPTR